MTTALLYTKIFEVEKKIPDTHSLVTTNVLNTKINNFQNKVPDHAKYITTQEFNKFTEKKFAARLKQANLVSKKKLPQIKLLRSSKKINSLITKDYNFFFDRISFTSNDGSQNTLVYQPKLDTLE